MDKKLHLLETHRAQGDDGHDYVVHGYEHLARFDGAPDFDSQWEPTGQAEYRLASGELINVDKAGTMTVATTGVKLQLQGMAAL